MSSNMNLTHWSQPIETLVSSNAQVLAVKIVNRLFVGGWRGSFSDGTVLTDRTWKCNSHYYPGWPNANFEDKFWPRARILTSLPGCRLGISADAKWLWTNADHYTAMTIFCRRSLSMNI